MEIPETPTLENILSVLFLVGVASYGITEVLKLGFRKLKPKQEDIDDPSWWQVIFRVIPITIGASLGHLFTDFPWGVVTGICSGVLAAIIYQRVKLLISKGDPPSRLGLP